jgi:hypothetical protein
MSKKLKIRLIESYQTHAFKESIEIDVSKYPELEGLSDQEIVEYIDMNADNMAPMNDIYETLYQELEDAEIETEKIPSMDSNVSLV